MSQVAELQDSESLHSSDDQPTLLSYEEISLLEGLLDEPLSLGEFSWLDGGMTVATSECPAITRLDGLVHCAAIQADLLVLMHSLLPFPLWRRKQPMESVQMTSQTRRSIPFVPGQIPL